MFSDEYFMKQALAEARNAFNREEIPVGAVIVANNTIIARAHNLTETLNDVTAHAEMQVITAAANAIGSKYLDECTLFVTLEPCAMCAGAIFWAQLQKLVYGASDPKRGYTQVQTPLLHPKTEILNGIMAHESEMIMREFFRKRR
ncbi:MAG: nucleoside deaminase [Bacteroidales bacterium]